MQWWDFSRPNLRASAKLLPWKIYNIYLVFSSLYQILQKLLDCCALCSGRWCKMSSIFGCSLIALGECSTRLDSALAFSRRMLRILITRSSHCMGNFNCFSWGFPAASAAVEGTLLYSTVCGMAGQESTLSRESRTVYVCTQQTEIIAKKPHIKRVHISPSLRLNCALYVSRLWLFIFPAWALNSAQSNNSANAAASGQLR